MEAHRHEAPVGPPPRGSTPSARSAHSDSATDPDATATLDPGFGAKDAAGDPEPQMQNHTSTDELPEPETPVFPIEGWDRYAPIRFLGKGGMGNVFLARDKRLDRDVAVKFVRSDGAASVRRFLSEARAQARVDHPNVCKVFEVGEVQGKAYIAMQLIHGRPLGAITSELTVEQRVLVVRDAALGVHEAHRVGIIHRDLKPGNILVERGDDGALHAFVVDFGLARAWKEDETETQTVIGTPHYMSPEQARGDSSQLDRRADVYSLGATLYAVLAGKPPIAGKSMLEVLSQIATHEPAPLQTIDRSLPADLSAIAHKCLEKDKAYRYESARALAEDLDRFLRGDAVIARSTGVLYRWKKWLKRHRVLVTLSAIAAILVLSAVGWGLRERSLVAEREQLARHFTEQADHIEAMARYSALAPLHDIRPDQAEIRKRMDALESEMRDAGDAATGPGHYALGRGALSLGDNETALSHLTRAWESGFQEPRVAYSLALVTGYLYREKLLEAERIQSANLREAKKREIAEKYRDPALAYLRKSEGADVPSPKYVAALLAFYEDKLDEALVHLDGIDKDLPWFYEAPALRGDVLLARGERRWNSGDRDGASSDFNAGRVAYTAASKIGESVPITYEALGKLEYGALLMELYGEGDVNPRFEKGLNALAKARIAAPDRVQSFTSETDFYSRLAEFEMQRGSQPEEALKQAVRAAEEALKRSPEDIIAKTTLAKIHVQWAECRHEQNQDAIEHLQTALRLFDEVPQDKRDYNYHVQIGILHQVWADDSAKLGGPSLEHRSLAIQAYKSAIALDDEIPAAWIDLGTLYLARASDVGTSGPEVDLQEASAALERARQLNPQNAVTFLYLGQTAAASAERRLSRGEDIRSQVSEALAAYERGIAINSALPHFYNAKGAIHHLEVQAAWDNGDDIEAPFRAAKSAFEQAIRLAPEQGFGQLNLSELLLTQAVLRNRKGEAAGPIAREAIKAAEAAVSILPDEASAWSNLAYARLLLAEIDGQRAAKMLDQKTTDAIERARALDAHGAKTAFVETQLLLATLKRERSSSAAALWERMDSLARQAADAATVGFPSRLYDVELACARLEDDRERNQWARVAQAALSRVEKLLQTRARWPEAQALRGAILLSLSEIGLSAEEKSGRATQARLDLEQAIQGNPHLRHRWENHLLRARRLEQ